MDGGLVFVGERVILFGDEDVVGKDSSIVENT